MKRYQSVQRFIRCLPIIAVLYTIGVFLHATNAVAFIAQNKRSVNNVSWNSQFQLNTALAGFPSSTRTLLAQAGFQ